VLAIGRDSEAEGVGSSDDGDGALHAIGIDDDNAPVALIERVEGLVVGGDGQRKASAEVVAAQRSED
jgi:hypothetical protein